jgi:hypothetical protein
MSKLNGACGAVSAEAAMSDPPPTPQAMRPETADFVETQRLDFEGWRAFLRASCGDQPEVIDASAFAGWVRPLRVTGSRRPRSRLSAGSQRWNFGRSAYRSERTHRDARFAGADYYHAAFQVARRSVLTQNDGVAELAVGDVALLDAARPAACFADDRSPSICRSVPLTRGDNLRRPGGGVGGHPGTVPPSPQVPSEFARFSGVEIPHRSRPAPHSDVLSFSTRAPGRSDYPNLLSRTSAARIAGIAGLTPVFSPVFRPSANGQHHR